MMDITEYFTDSTYISFLYSAPQGNNDLTNYVGEVVISNSLGGNVYVGPVQLGSTGQVELTIPNTVNIGLGEGDYTYAITITSPSLFVDTIQTGMYKLVSQSTLASASHKCKVRTRQSLDDSNTVYQRGLQGLTGGDIQVEQIAGEDIQAFAPVISVAGGIVMVARTTNLSHRGHVIGVANSTVLSGETVVINTAGEIKNPAWNFTLGDVFLGNAEITNTFAVVGFSQVLGVATEPDTIIFNLGDTYIL